MENREDFDDIKKAKEAKYSSIGSKPSYCIFRCGKKFRNENKSTKTVKRHKPNDVSNRTIKSIPAIKAFSIHMNRDIEVQNADPNLTNENEILVGSKNIVEDTMEYIKDVPFIRTNGIVGRELMLTASPEFFRGLIDTEKEQWIRLNKEWLQDLYGDNLRFLIIHKDEKTWHLHGLVVSKFYSQEDKCYKLQDYKYFDGIKKFGELQDSYSAKMQSVFKSLNRGVKHSKARHLDIMQFYTILNKRLDKASYQSVAANAVQAELLQRQVEGLQKTLQSYQKYSKGVQLDKEYSEQQLQETLKELQEAKKDRKLYMESIKTLSENLHIPKSSIVELVNNVEKQLSGEREK